MKAKERAFEDLGGEKKKLKDAILKGKGNKKEPVLAGITLLGIYGPENIYEQVDGFDQDDEVNGLGEPASVAGGAAIASATALIASWAGSLDKVKNLFPKSVTKNLEFNAPSSVAELAENVKDLNTEAQAFAPGVNPVSAAQIEAIERGVKEGTIDPVKEVQQTTGENISAESLATGAQSEKNKWILPVSIAGGVLVTSAIAYLVLKPKPKAVTPLVTAAQSISGYNKKKPFTKNKISKKPASKKIQVIHL